MKSEIKAMLPELPCTVSACDVKPLSRMYFASHIEAWLDKLTEGAKIKYGSALGNVLTTVCEPEDTHTHLVIPLGEIKKQTPLEIAVEALERIRDCYDDSGAHDRIACEALAQIEAAT